MPTAKRKTSKRKTSKRKTKPKSGPGYKTVIAGGDVEHMRSLTRNPAAVVSTLDNVPEYIADNLLQGDTTQQIGAIAAMVAEIYAAIFEFDPTTKKRTTKPLPYADRTRKARIALAAKREGLSIEEYVAKYGNVDTPKKAEPKAKKATKRPSKRASKR
jgi:hypothetical protein